MSKLTEHFTREELTQSRHDLPNQPPKEWDDRLLKVAQKLEQARAILSENAGHDCPMRVTYGYRSLEENIAAGGSETSAHCEALAVDFVPKLHTLRNAWDILRCHPTFMEDVDQMIIERGCIHIGLPLERYNWVPRHELRLDATKANGQRYYPLWGHWLPGGGVNLT